jgi:hypothetical protein
MIPFSEQATQTDTVTNTSLLLVDASQAEGMAKWTDEKRKEFATLFEDRAKVARYIFIKTAEIMLDSARNRKFISQFHIDKLDLKISYEPFYVEHAERQYGVRRYMPQSIGGRTVEQLNKIADERADQILKELPPLKAAVRVISKDTANNIDKRDALLAKLRIMKQRLEEMAGSYSLGEVDQKMTIGEFRKGVRDRDRKRAALSRQMNDMGQAGIELDNQINKALYMGLPGLSDAVMKVVADHLERAVAFDQTTRRVTEKVLFGDSQAAMELLKGFERDEVTVSDNIKAEFSAAMLKLGISAGKKTKQLRTTKKKKR